MLDYLILFLSSFAAATIFPIPIYSEGVLLYYLDKGLNPLLLLILSSIGNVLGAVINYYLGVKGAEYVIKKGYVKEENIKTGKRYFDRFGPFALLLSWAPYIGDPITFFAGIIKYDIKKFIILVSIAKSVRYILIIKGFYFATDR